MKNPFEEYQLGDKYVLRFYRVDNRLICSIDEWLADELHKVVNQLNEDAWKYKDLCK